MRATIREGAEGWLFLVDGQVQGVVKAWDAEDAKREATRRLGIMVEWEPRGDLEYIAVVEDGPIQP